MGCASPRSSIRPSSRRPGPIEQGALHTTVPACPAGAWHVHADFAFASGRGSSRGRITSDAQAQSTLDPRIELLVARDASTLFSRIPIPLYLIIFNVTRAHLGLAIVLPGDQKNLDEASCIYRNELRTVGKCRDSWVMEIAHKLREERFQKLHQAITSRTQPSPFTQAVQKQLTSSHGNSSLKG